MKLLAVLNGAVFIIFFPLWKFFSMSLWANANFQIQQSPWDLTRANLQLDLTIWSRTLPPPPPLPHLVHLRIAPIRLSIKIIMLQRKYKNDIRMEECHRRNIRFDFEFKSTLLHWVRGFSRHYLGSNIFEILGHITHYIISLQNEISRFSPYKRGRSEYTKSFLTLPWKSKGLFLIRNFMKVWISGKASKQR